ncbi:hypothetical protein A3B56_01630 [Candidatus Roizmanbacteria bacterium RIFCSPLOWO2_01_FULL_45_11]|uniref:Uncharacterized protein n=1 Tax=Candidatus Roizmanbacteria bacterium RIFCSPLOWO2_01_FULL_45_11 TaxID=1802070 RepID=A0A1F7JF92_9BACT|nr:MAG: hypothetical protein A3B56_01630 [Candidatus Roizmanbacteria bacterium RIFCSPLOWO2_01_FULL_45_11]
MVRKNRKHKKSRTRIQAQNPPALQSTTIASRPLSDTAMSKLERDKQLILRDLRKTTILSALAIAVLFVILFVQ